MEQKREEVYTFGRPYKIKLLAMMSRTSTFLRSHRDVLAPKYMEDPVLVDVARLALDYFDKYTKPPTVDALLELVFDFLRDNPKRQAQASEYALLLEEVQKATLEEKEHLTDKVIEFAQETELFQALLESADDIDGGNRGNVLKRVQKALQVGVNRLDLGLDYWADTSRLSEDRSQRTVSTGLELLDKYLYGGIGLNEMGVIEGPTGRFKTGMLVNLGKSALKAGCDVVHMSFEVRANQVARRYDGCILGKVTRKCVPDEIQDELDKYHRQLRRSLRIKSWPISSATVSDLRGYLWALASEGVIQPGLRPLMLIADYGQIMKAEKAYAEKRHEHRENYQGLIRLAEEFEACLWTGMQSNRQSVNKKLIGIEDLSECFLVAADAHIILSLNQTKEERGEDFMRVFVAKSRESMSFKTVDVEVDYDLTRMVQRFGQDDGTEEVVA
jgi:replicative DNA helicase